MKNTTLLVIFFAIGLLSAVFHTHLFDWVVNLGMSWTFAFLLPWILVSLFAGLFAWELRKRLKQHYKIWVPLLAFLLFLGLHFSLNPIYEGDLNKFGKEKKWQENQILEDVLAYDSNFEGLVCVASPNCPYCIEAVQKKINAIHKRGHVQIIVYLGNGGEQEILLFRDRAQAFEVPIILNSHPEDGIDIDENVIPVFVYIKNQTVTHLWRNDQLGYRALDWIEKRLP